MSSSPLFYYNDAFGKTIPHVLELTWQITAAKTVVANPLGLPVMPLFDAVASQAVINAYLNTTDEFTLAQFDSTSMGADAFGGLVAMKGQAASAVSMIAKCYSGTGGSTIVERGVIASTLTASTLETAFAVGAYGNLAFKIDFGNTPDFDALTSGMIKVWLAWVAK